MSNRDYWEFSLSLLWVERVVEMVMLCDHDELVSLLILRCVGVGMRDKAEPGQAGILILVQHSMMVSCLMGNAQKDVKL